MSWEKTGSSEEEERFRAKRHRIMYLKHSYKSKIFRFRVEKKNKQKEPE